MTLYSSCINAEKHYLKTLLQKRSIDKSKQVIIGDSSLEFAKTLDSIPEGSIFIKEETENIPTIIIPTYETLKSLSIVEKYKCIILLDYLAKTSQPREYLDLCYNLLKEEGYILISVPNIKNSYWNTSEEKPTISDHFRWKAHFDVNSLVIEKDFTMGVIKNASFIQSLSQLLQFKSKKFLSGNLKKYYLL